MALDDLFNHPRAEKFIANPVEGSGYFTANDPVILRHMPRETFEGRENIKSISIMRWSRYRHCLKWILQGIGSGIYYPQM